VYCISNLKYLSDILRRHIGLLHGPSPSPSRVSQACIRCHQNKTKCNGKLPCLACAHRDFPCGYPQPHVKAQQGLDSVPSPDGSGQCVQSWMSRTPLKSVLGTSRAIFPDLSGKSEIIACYFEKFHPSWQLLHQETFESKPVPDGLLHAVLTIGLWFQATPESRALSAGLHDKLILDVANRSVSPLIRSGLIPFGAFSNPTLRQDAKRNRHFRIVTTLYMWRLILVKVY
jgi:hypothetical protein